ncbi:hypothetical protein AQUSIP_07030 [Aquicella siphonis]|uniref:Uncharacterized protein n=1 Tax=Aquicella siphonis TaxID=254247 RepID=A0A5E4PG87_9COXI|nr:hypothetical protein [Aquicella siphonis]VVC75413.1 hypothetical protein AQUSIP_07030 [Aquicella siphonis]
MLFGFFTFQGASRNLSDEEKIIAALQICQKAVNDLEKTITDEMCQYARKTNNYKKDLEVFTELYEIEFLQPYLLNSPSILAAYKKRDFFLNLQAILLGDEPDDYIGTGKILASTKHAPVSKTIGEYKNNIGIHLCPQDPEIRNAIIREKPATIALKEKVQKAISNPVNTETKTPRQSPAARIRKASYFHQDHISMLQSFRDTSDVDGWFWGVIRQLGRLFQTNCRTSAISDEIKPLLTTQSNTHPDSQYISLERTHQTLRN